MKHTVRTLCLLLALALVLSLLPSLQLPAAAANVAINSTNFPDANFRSFVSKYDTDGSSSLSSAELAAVKEMICSDKSISSLKGVEHFTSLVTLNCAKNTISTLDLSKNTKLVNLYCYSNQLSGLDLSKLTGLKTLKCGSNGLVTLDLRSNPALTTLDCSICQLRSLNLSANTALQDVDCSWNTLNALDVTMLPKLKRLHCIDDKLTTLNVTKNPLLERLYCGVNQLTSMDVSKNTALIQLLCYNNQIAKLDVSANQNLEYLDCSGNTIWMKSLTLGKNTKLRVLCVEANYLETLDVSRTPIIKNTILYGTLKCGSNGHDTYTLDDSTVIADHDLVFFLGEYPLKVCGVRVTVDNRADVLGDGVFSFDGARMLTVKGSCSASQNVIENEGIDGLRIRVLQDAVLSTTASNCILARDDTRVTGPGKLTLKSTNSSGAGIFAIEKNVAVTVEQADLEIRAKYGIVGPDGTNAAHLTLDHSTVYVVESIGGAIIDFGGGITLRNERLYAPAGGGVSEAGDAIVTSYGSAANVVQILKTGWKNPFTDVPQDKYYYTPALWAYFRDPQITNGTSNTTFGPAKECKREQVMTFLWKAAGAPEPETASCPFTDVPKTKYYYKPILWAVENGITGGVSATKFGVGKPCTREQIVTFLWKYAGAPEPLADSCPFTDVPKTKYYYEPILWAVENGITGGVSAGKFGVGKTCTRGQVVTFLYKLMVG